jgi:hypothetical protein
MSFELPVQMLHIGEPDAILLASISALVRWNYLVEFDLAVFPNDFWARENISILFR